EGTTVVRQREAASKSRVQLTLSRRFQSIRSDQAGMGRTASGETLPGREPSAVATSRWTEIPTCFGAEVIDCK
ncbi:hypothetical protein, partial [Luteimonas viscosa]|uniref:hypothetical protein n=1 Tax=Luteimonas viscosa TaxID=1132694 RepID=UPI001CA4036A